jgi:hypothetical protein
MNIVINEFNSYNKITQIAIYAEALLIENYELLNIISNCILPENKELFLKSVKEYTKLKNSLT